MNTLTYSTMIVCGLALTGCFNNKVPVSDAESGLSTVDIAIPTTANLQKAYGPNCERANLNPAVLAQAGNATGCDAVKKLTNEYRLTVKGGACADGTTGTSAPAATGKLDNQSIQTELKRNCDYSVKLELGLGGAYYFDNTATWNDNLPRAKVSGPTAELTIRLRPTGAGVAAGLPGDTEVESTGTTNLKIKVKFNDGGEGGDAQGDGGSTQPDPNNGAPVVFIAPQGWDGTTFEGDNVFHLQNLSN